jgi:hypothetical protein
MSVPCVAYAMAEMNVYTTIMTELATVREKENCLLSRISRMISQKMDCPWYANMMVPKEESATRGYPGTNEPSSPRVTTTADTGVGVDRSTSRAGWGLARSLQCTCVEERLPRHRPDGGLDVGRRPIDEERDRNHADHSEHAGR